MRLGAVLVPLAALGVGLAAGAAGAVLLGPDAEAPAEGAPAEAAAETPPPPPETDAAPEFAEFGNQFVVPVVRDGAVRALVLVTIGLEVTEGGSGEVFAIEPRLRDAFLQVLFDHANTGGFDDRFTQGDRMSLLRQALRETAQRLLGPTLRDVLILDIVRQDA